MPLTEAQRRAAAAYEKRFQENGGVKFTVRLQGRAAENLAKLVETHGSREKALDALLTAPPVQDTKARPVAVDEGKQAERRSREHTKSAKTSARISVDVPLAGTFKRPIPQKSSPKPKR